MDTDSSSSVSGRNSRTSVSALLIVGLLLGVTLNAVQPGMRSLHRDAAAELLATRQIAQSLARAVRELAGADVHKPAIRTASFIGTPPVTPIFNTRLDHACPVSVTLLREALLSLPPPQA